MFSSNTSQVAAVATQAEAIDFDGTNDFLSRTSDLVGNVDGKTFTFSAWVWLRQGYQYLLTGKLNTSNGRFEISTNSNRQIAIIGRDSSGTVVLNASVNYTPDLQNTFVNLLVSVDLANTSNRSVYFNDILQSTTWSTYTNTNINFTYHNGWNIGADAQGGSKIFGRLSNVFLDYTYRDLSVTANRRLFVTADLKPAAGQAALNPILYLPMSDPTQPGLNQGTGGNFTLTGVVARSGRGPNQYNAPYSDLDGAADYLSRTSIVGIADSFSFTVHCAFSTDVTAGAQKIVFFGSDASCRFQVAIDPGGQINLQGYNSSGTQIFGVTTSASVVAGRNYVLDVSVNLGAPSLRHFYLNGQSVSVTWDAYTANAIDFSIANTPRYYIGANTSATPSQLFNGRLGALWFSTDYIDLSVAANLAKFVSGTGINAAPVDLGASGELPTGTAAKVYLPMYGNNAGKNYGTGGDFTVNSGPYTGARGPNEFWGNKARGDNPDGSNNQGLIRTTQLAGIADSKTFSCSFWVQFNSSSGGLREDNIAGFWIANSNATWRIFRDTSDNLRIVAGSRLSATVSGAITTSPAFVQICVDLADTAKRFVYINGVAQTVTWSTYVNNLIDFTVATQTLMCRYTTGAAGGMDGSLGEFYFTTDYIDFSQEANRLKFRDAFGNPTDLPSAITALSVPNPAIYMRFPPTAFGTNSGTGGNFTVNGTITDGGQL